jgi:hypothetical protein
MLELLDRQQPLTVNQWKIFAAYLFSIGVEFAGVAASEIIGRQAGRRLAV